MRAPSHIKTAIGGTERRDVDAAFGEQSRPCAISAKAGPACAAKSEYGRVDAEGDIAFKCVETEGAFAGPSGPAMACVEGNALLRKPPRPGAQQRRGFHGGGEDAARTADESFNAKGGRPVAYRFRGKARKGGLKLRARSAEACQKSFEGFTMRDVEAALACEQKFATERWHGFEKVDICHLAKLLCRSKARRAATNNGHARPCAGF